MLPRRKLLSKGRDAITPRKRQSGDPVKHVLVEHEEPRRDFPQRFIHGDGRLLGDLVRLVGLLDRLDDRIAALN